MLNILINIKFILLSHNKRKFLKLIVVFVYFKESLLLHFHNFISLKYTHIKIQVKYYKYTKSNTLVRVEYQK